MRVEPNFAGSLVGSLQQVAATEQTLTGELSSGVRVQKPSDDPLSAGESVTLTAQMAQDDSFVQSAASEQSRMQATDSALGSVVTQLTSAISLAVQAGNGTEGASELQAVGAQLSGIRDSVLSLANSSYQGSYLFAGSKTGTQPYALGSSTTPATAVYSGDTQTQTVMTPEGQAIAVNVAGNAIFSNPAADVLGTLNGLIAQLATGTAGAGTESAVGTLTAALTNVSSQRVPLDTALSAMQSASEYTQTQATQLSAAKSTMVAADTAQVATQLSQAETQNSALLSVISTLEKGSLFDYTH
jgi:flagellar hook-associated protein 3 FlgL